MHIFLFTFLLFFPSYFIHCLELPQAKPDILSLMPYAVSWCAHTFITQQMPDYLSLPSPRVQLVNMGISAIFIGISWCFEILVKSAYHDQKITFTDVKITDFKEMKWNSPSCLIIFFRGMTKVVELITLSMMHTTVLGTNGCLISKKHLLGTSLYFFTMQLLSVGLLYKYKREEYGL